MATSRDFEHWYSQEHPRLVTVLTVVLGSAEAAAEAAAEAFTRAYERWPRVSTMDSPAGWTYRVAINVARRRARRLSLERRLRPQLFRRDESEPPDGLAGDLWAAVRRLPTRQRAVLALRVVHDLPQSQVAQILGIKGGTVSASLAAARQRLRAELDGDVSSQEEFPP